ncbi:MATE family efflux transporter [Vibrio sp. UCD-FRSSP16_10]|uniref:MATE family efflux transporter DinF n=1 Tax=unclassified Vibrio TaxID=2614977 RepID=UPI000800DE10|nr:MULTISPECIES: MATE family efflux transporter DinF [unclassified Vibrio]OBT12950.1 MATE family efflux transporter [Vibrio sp. UCD-FRSSP16_30]OBT19195.1 MATE family efflux transporter [Vibrio sp. UCD-FRSSP16_10]
MQSQVFRSLMDLSLHKKILVLAIPMVLSNITVPLLGLVDAAVVGHLEHSWYLGGVALGSTMISMVFWLFGFLRMSTTGLSAQAKGATDPRKLALVLIQGIVMALSFAIIFLILHRGIISVALSVSDASDKVQFYAFEYFAIRAWSAPAAMVNFVLLGWLLGNQNAKAPMWMVIATNVTNIVLDVLFVVVLHFGVAGAAYASVIADYTGAAVGIYFCHKAWSSAVGLNFQQVMSLGVSKLFTGVSRFVRLNRDIFLRSLCLQAVLAFMTFQGANFGDDVVAANAVLMSLVLMVSYAMDGFAYAIEAMVGKAIGAKDKAELSLSILGSFFWGLIVCCGFALLFGAGGSWIVSLISDIESVRLTAGEYLPWLAIMPLISMWCYLFDGIFIGATRGKEMRNSMFLASLVFFALYFGFASLQNHSLWIAMLGFMGMRGATLGWVFIKLWKSGRFLHTAHA